MFAHSPIRPAVSDARAVHPIRAGHPEPLPAAHGVSSPCPTPFTPPPPIPPRQRARRSPSPRAPCSLRRLLSTGVIPAEDFDALSVAERQAIDREPDDGRLLEALHIETSHRVPGDANPGRPASRDRARELPRARSHPAGAWSGLSRRTPAAAHAGGDRASPLAGPEPRAPARFFQEARAVGGLKHPNIVAAIDAGEEAAAGPDQPAIPYFVMELIAGMDSNWRWPRDRCRSASPATSPPGGGCPDRAHRHALVHRDIKPSNVIVTPDGQRPSTSACPPSGRGTAHAFRRSSAPSATWPPNSAMPTRWMPAPMSSAQRHALFRDHRPGALLGCAGSPRRPPRGPCDRRSPRDSTRPSAA